MGTKHFILFAILGFLTCSFSLLGQSFGEIDPGFKTSQTFGPNDPNYWGEKLKARPDGKFIYSGKFQNFSGHPSPGLALLDSNGLIDTSFSVDLFACNPTDFEILANGKILVWGDFKVTENSNSLGLIRLNSNGSLDNSFSPISNRIANLVVLSNGNLIAVDNNFGYKIISFTSEGQPISGFTQIPYDYHNSLLSLPDSSFLVYTPAGGALKKYSMLGQLNTDFQCPVNTTWSFFSKSLPNGKILVNTDNGLVRLLGNGKIDSSFYQQNSKPGPIIHIDENGKIFVFSSREYAKNQILAFHPNGQPDSLNSFFFREGNVSIINNKNGWIGMGYTNLNRLLYDGFEAFRYNKLGIETWKSYSPGFNSPIEKIIQYPDKRILVSGSFSKFGNFKMAYLARLFPDGSLDSSFRSPFSFLQNYSKTESIEELSTSNTGKILALKLKYNLGSTPIKEAFLLNENGSFDSAFNLQLSSVSSGDTLNLIDNIFIGPNQKIYAKIDLAYPDYPIKSKIVRFSLNGQLDPGFSPKFYGNTNLDSVFSGLHLDSDSTLILENSNLGFVSLQYSKESRINSLIRIRLDGSIKEGFHFSGRGGLIKSIQSDISGNLYISCLDGGWLPSGGGSATSLIMKIKANGIEDSLLRQETGFSYDLSGIENPPFGFFASKTGELVSFNSGLKLEKICPSGISVSGNNPTIFSGGYVYAMCNADSSSFYVAGGFASINGKSINRIARLKNSPCQTTGIQKSEKAESFSLFPNPGKEQINIRFRSGQNASHLIQIYDMQGKMMFTKTSSNYLKNEDVAVPVPQLQKGIYLIKMLSNGKQFTQKWVKE